MLEPTGQPLLAVMGVSGSGKSTVGRLLADRLGCDFVDGDELHPSGNVAKMSAGVALDDEDRWPWLETVGSTLAAAKAAGRGLVIACSALRMAHREVISRAEPATRFVHLVGSRELLASRLDTRRGHFMPGTLLDSQLATLEPLADDEPGVTIAVGGPPDAIVADVLARLRSKGRLSRC